MCTGLRRPEKALLWRALALGERVLLLYSIAQSYPLRCTGKEKLL